MCWCVACRRCIVQYHFGICCCWCLIRFVARAVGVHVCSGFVLLAMDLLAGI